MDEAKEVEIKIYDNLIAANILRNKIMENVPRVWVIVKNPKPTDPNYRVCIMNVWGSSPSKDQLDSCAKFIN